MFGSYGYLRATAEYCPQNKPHQAGFDINQYVGRWYEFRREGDLPFEIGTCSAVNYDLRDDNLVNVANSEFRPADDTHPEPFWITFTGKAQYSKWNPGKIGVTVFPEAYWGDYNVISTDYTSYTIIYSCAYLLPRAVKFVEALWVMTREPLVIGTPEHDAMDELTRPIIEKLLPRYDFTNSIFATQGSASCDYPW